MTGFGVVVLVDLEEIAARKVNGAPAEGLEPVGLLVVDGARSARAPGCSWGACGPATMSGRYPRRRWPAHASRACPRGRSGRRRCRSPGRRSCRRSVVAKLADWRDLDAVLLGSLHARLTRRTGVAVGGRLVGGEVVLPRKGDLVGGHCGVRGQARRSLDLGRLLVEGVALPSWRPRRGRARRRPSTLHGPDEPVVRLTRPGCRAVPPGCRCRSRCPSRAGGRTPACTPGWSARGPVPRRPGRRHAPGTGSHSRTGVRRHVDALGRLRRAARRGMRCKPLSASRLVPRSAMRWPLTERGRPW